MPAPAARSRSDRSCTLTSQPRRASEQAAARPAKPAPMISAFRFAIIERPLIRSTRTKTVGVLRPRPIMCYLRYIRPVQEWRMARLRHFAVCVRDLEKSANFYEQVFGLKRVGEEVIEIGSAIYMSDGVINLALLNFSSTKG